MDVHICGNSCKVQCRKMCFRRFDRPESLVTFSFMDAGLRLWFFRLVFISLLTVSFARLS